MASFDLGRFRDLAFGRRSLPDHPMGNVEEARKILALLPDDDPDYGIAELTHWTASLGATDSFTRGRRGRVLMELHEAARPLWRALGQRYLAPEGVPSEGRDGDPAILRAMFDSASEFAAAFAVVLYDDDQKSSWVEENLAALSVRMLRWLSRRLALAYMLHLGQSQSIWERLHYARNFADARGVFRAAVPAFEGSRHPSSPLAEYARALLLELVNPSALRPRDVELAYRIAARVATTVRLEDAPSTEANFAVVPWGDAVPGPVQARAKPGARPTLYINTVNALPRLRGMVERDLGRDPSEEDTLFGRGYTIRERSSMLARAISHWGMDPPRRGAQRIGMAASARLVAGFDSVTGVLPAVQRGAVEDGAKARRELQLLLDESTGTLKRDQLRAARVGPARVVDASAGGLGLAIRRADAPWAAHGALLAIMVEPATDWFLGVLRRIYSVEEELRLGIQILAAKPMTVTFRTEAVARDHPWEEAMRFEASFQDHFQRGILLEPQGLPLAAADLLLPPGLASRGSQFSVPLDKGVQRIRVTRVLDESRHFQRARIEPLDA